MIETKRVFMQNAPTFVFAGALWMFSLVLIVGARLIISGDMFGLYLIGLILAASGTIVYASWVFSKGCDKSLPQLMKEHREYWGNNGHIQIQGTGTIQDGDRVPIEFFDTVSLTIIDDEVAK